MSAKERARLAEGAEESREDEIRALRCEIVERGFRRARRPKNVIEGAEGNSARNAARARLTPQRSAENA